MYKIKQIPEDFLVWEIPNYKLDEEGIYSYFWLRKKSCNTLDVLRQIAIKLNMPMKAIGFAGSKDRNAVTEQVISVYKGNPEKIVNLNINNVELTFIGKGKEKIALGCLEGNRFRIIVRNIEKRFLVKSLDRIPNYFGEQRFSENNVEIGRNMVKRNFQKAVELIDQDKVKEFLEENPGNFAGALRTLPLKLRKLFVHAYQSYLWNKCVEDYMESNPYKNEKIPLLGFGTEFGNKEIEKIYNKLMNVEKIIQRDFIIKQIPELSSEGSERDLFMEVGNFSISDTEEDELNERKYKCALSFSLKKGSYATILVDYLFRR